MNFRLAPTAFVHFAADSAVVLDTKSNRYHGLQADQAGALQRALGQNAAAQYPVVTDSDVATFAAALEARGILTTTADSSGASAAPGVTAPTHSLADAPRETTGGANARHALPISLLYLKTACWMKRGRLDTALEHLRKLRKLRKLQAARATRTPGESIELVRRFDAVRPFIYSSKDQCLLDSLVLAQFLFSHNVCPTFLIGVRTLPFAAHSWLQLDDCVLNGPLYFAQRSNVIVAI